MTATNAPAVPDREKVTSERVAQGLPPTITDPATLAKVATLIGRRR